MHNNEDYYLGSIHFELEQLFSKLLWAAYVRHFLDVRFWAKRRRMFHITSRNSVFRSQSPASSRGFTVVGMSGIGKSRSL
jgi:hypothetical protein